MLPTFFVCGLLLLGKEIVAATVTSPEVLHLERRLSSNSTNPTPSHNIELNATQFGQRFDVEVKLGNESFLLLVDTGSSDLWVTASDWQCIDDNSNATLPREACNFAPKSYDTTSIFQPVSDEFFGEQLGGGRASGIIGREDITIGNVLVKGQQIGVVNKTSIIGDGINSGIIGLGYPSMTSAHIGSIVNVSNQTFDFNRAVYNPLFNSMYEQGLVEPFFSIALERAAQDAVAGPGGYLALGGLPPVLYDPTFATVPVEIAPIPLNYTNNKRQISWWTIMVDAVAYGTNGISPNHVTTNSTPFLAVVDTGNWFNFLPGDIVDEVNKLFDPPAVLNSTAFPQTYSVDCSAKAPAFGIQIGGHMFYHNGNDLILPTGDGSCISALISYYDVSFPGGITGSILGDTFLKNVVAVFDFGKNEMRFAARPSNNTGLSLTNAPSSNSTRNSTLPAVSSSGQISMTANRLRGQAIGLFVLFFALLYTSN